MRSFMRVLLAIWCSGSLLVAFAQETTISSGFAIVTVVSGNIGGLIGSETLRNSTVFDVDQAVVGPSPLITSASILAPVGPIAENTTAIAIANPSAGAGGVNLILTDEVGGVVLDTVVNVGPFGQLSRYLNDFLASEPTTARQLLLTVSSEIPIAILAFQFRGNDFASIPLTSLSAPTPVPIQPITATPIPPPTPALTTSTFAGFGLGITQVPTVTFPVGTFPTGTFTTVPAPTVASTLTIGGATALTFTQVASGGGWATDITIGNTSAGLQVIRIDFFNSDGIQTRSLTDIAIPSRGVFFFSTDPASAGVFQ